MINLSAFSGSEIIVNTEKGDDTLSVYAPDAGVDKSLTFNGGMGADALNLGSMSGMNFPLVNHTFASASSGSVQIGTSLQIDYAGLEPINDALTAKDREFDFSGVSDVITLANSSSGVSVVSTMGTSETVTFNNPSLRLTIRGNGGNDHSGDGDQGRQTVVLLRRHGW